MTIRAKFIVATWTFLFLFTVLLIAFLVTDNPIFPNLAIASCALAFVCIVVLAVTGSGTKQASPGRRSVRPKVEGSVGNEIGVESFDSGNNQDVQQCSSSDSSPKHTQSPQPDHHQGKHHHFWSAPHSGSHHSSSWSGNHGVSHHGGGFSGGGHHGH